MPVVGVVDARKVRRQVMRLILVHFDDAPAKVTAATAVSEVDDKPYQEPAK